MFLSPNVIRSIRSPLPSRFFGGTSNLPDVGPVPPLFAAHSIYHAKVSIQHGSV